LFYVGDEDYNISPFFAHNADPEVPLIRQLFGGPDCYIRWPKYEEVYQSVGCKQEFIVIPGLDHSPDWDTEINFFEYNRASPTPKPRPKPLLYKVFFPHVASYDPWSTEIAIAGTVGGVSIRGELETFDDEGNQLEMIPVTIPAGGRFETSIDKIFQNPDRVAYISFHSDSGFLTAYTRFYEKLNRIAIPARVGTERGWFPKNESDGWTGIAFVNTEQQDAEVILEAVNDQGSVIESINLNLPAGAKVVRMGGELFSCPLSSIGFYRYSSNRKLLGFSVNGSSDGLLMDGMAAGIEYLRVNTDSRLDW
jgi:hypothetical protein